MFCHSPFFSKYSHLLCSHTCFSACYSSSPPCSSTSCMQLLLSQQRWQRMPQPPPQSDTSCHCHSSSATTGALWHRKEGLDGVRADWGEEGCRRHWLHGTANIRLTGERAGRLPTGPRSRDTLQPTWQNTSVGGTCVCVSVCVLCMDDIPCSLRGQMSAVETERERGCDGSTQPLFCCQTEEKGRYSLAAASLHQLIHQL